MNTELLCLFVIFSLHILTQGEGEKVPRFLISTYAFHCLCVCVICYSTNSLFDHLPHMTVSMQIHSSFPLLEIRLRVRVRFFLPFTPCPILNLILAPSVKKVEIFLNQWKSPLMPLFFPARRSIDQRLKWRLSVWLLTKLDESVKRQTRHGIVIIEKNKKGFVLTIRKSNNSARTAFLSILSIQRNKIQY